VTPSPGLAVITGASSGIGRAFAESLAATGHPLMLIARREDRLRQASHELADAHGVEVGFVVADLATAAGRETCREAIDTIGGVVDTVILNAGFGGNGSVLATGRERQTSMVAVNCEAVVDLATHVLPGMVERGYGTIVVVSSAAAFQPIPYAATYAASKAFDLFFAHALHAELQGTGVEAIAVCPGPAETEFFDAAGSSGFPRIVPRESAGGVVAATWRALERGRPYVATGPLARVTTLLAGILPRRLVVWAAGALHRTGERTR
jgi:short-subunit dehydrogenase